MRLANTGERLSIGPRSTETQKWQNCSSLITRRWKHWTRTFVQHQSGGQLTVLNMVGIAGQGTTRGPSRHCSKLAPSLLQSCKAPMECERCSERTESQNNYELNNSAVLQYLSSSVIAASAHHAPAGMR